jgi:hypothetical protein
VAARSFSSQAAVRSDAVDTRGGSAPIGDVYVVVMGEQALEVDRYRGSEELELAGRAGSRPLGLGV